MRPHRKDTQRITNSHQKAQETSTTGKQKQTTTKSNNDNNRRYNKDNNTSYNKNNDTDNGCDNDDSDDDNDKQSQVDDDNNHSDGNNRIVVDEAKIDSGIAWFPRPELMSRRASAALESIRDLWWASAHLRN